MKEIIVLLLIIAHFYFVVSAIAFGFRHPCANQLNVFTHFSEVIHWENVERLRCAGDKDE